MSIPFASVQWRRVFLAGIGASALTSVFVFLVVGVYAMALAMQAGGAPDNEMIEQVADQVGNWGSPLIAILLTLGFATRIARKVEAEARLHGVLVGLVVAILGLIISVAFGGAVDLLTLAGFVLTLLAGWLGGTLGERQR